jgi:signal transduction histidine kinase
MIRFSMITAKKIGLLFSLSILCTAVFSQDTLTQPIYPKHTITVKGDMQYYPYEFINEDGKADGFQVDLFRAIMDNLNIKYTLVLENWGKVHTEVREKKIDAVLGMMYSPTRAEYVKFGLTVFMIHHSYVCRKDNDYKSMEDLRGKEIVVQNRDRGHDFLLETGLTDKIIVVQSIKEGIELVASGEHDAALFDNNAIYYTIKKNKIKGLSLHESNMPPQRYSIAVNSDNYNLLYLLNMGLYQLIVSGEYDRIYNKWFGFWGDKNFNIYLLYATIGIFVFLLLLLVFVVLLRNRVKHATKDILIQKQRAEESDRLKSAFIANMSHEIRTPLNAIVGFSSIVCESDDSQEREFAKNIIVKNNELLLKLVNDILDISKLESGTIKVDYSTFYLEDLCIGAFTSVLVNKERFNNNEVEMHNNVDIKLLITSDYKLLTQVITNLLVNALKFTSKGSVTLDAAVVNGDLIEISITDTGVGIDEDNISMVFERFNKLDSHAQGFGLGLTICKKIVEILSGRIGVNSEKGKGSKFWFRIPIHSNINN